jgi:hypothetical protein
MLRDACIELLEDPPVLEAVMAIDDDILELVAKNCPQLLKEMWAYEMTNARRARAGHVLLRKLLAEISRKVHVVCLQI